MLDLHKLGGQVPQDVLQQISSISERFKIENNLRLAHFLSQCAHESGGFKVVVENLRYSPSRLRKIFPGYFPSDEIASSYAYKPVMIASRVYGGRMGNGDESSQEGYRFRGRGYIQMTGKNNYRSFSKFIGEDCVANPDLVATKYPLASAAFFFNSKGLWSICDKGSGDQIVEEVTLKVNGGRNGLEERLSYFKKYYSLLNS